jgi:diadenosine tetraphosphate (Ap4A) HIT family hydrolase
MRRLGGMSKWTDPEEWARLLSREGCPICRRGQPTSVIAELETSWVVMGRETPPLPGTCALFFRRHAIELHDLSVDEAAAYIRDIQRLSGTLKEITRAIKLNYEVHGNTIPHLHMHFFPRYVGDPFQGGPINPRALSGSAHATELHSEVRQRLQAVLKNDSDQTALC